MVSPRWIPFLSLEEKSSYVAFTTTEAFATVSRRGAHCHEKNRQLEMASTLSRRKGVGTPRRNNGAGSSGPTPFSARESMSHTNGAPHGTGVWETGRLERSLPSVHHHSTMSSSSHHHQHHHQQAVLHNNYNASSGKNGYKTACRDRWINTSKTMMGERAEVAMSSGCIYEGVIHVLTPSGPTPGGSRSMYQVRTRGNREVFLR